MFSGQFLSFNDLYPNCLSKIFLVFLLLDTHVKMAALLVNTFTTWKLPNTLWLWFPQKIGKWFFLAAFS